MNGKQKTLFQVANSLYRKGNIKDACLIYELLAENSPDFQCYSESEKLAKLMAGIKGDSKIHTNKSSNFQRRLRVSSLVLNHELPYLIEACFKGITLPSPEIHLAKASILFNSNEECWLKLLNKYLLCFDLSPLVFKASKASSDKELFLNLTSPKLNSFNGPLVSVCMSCYNAERYIEHAARSILNQTYKNIELLIFNDKSTDNSLSIIKRLQKEDDRVKIFNNKVNQGTYVNRNQAFQSAKGDYFTILDADDFALPQRIELQVRQLEKNPNHIGLTNEWVRLFIDGKFHYVSWLGGRYQHEAVATMMIRTHICREKAGYWDSVRFAADTEYQHRLYRIFGKDNLPLIKIPTVLSLFHESSLTNDPNTGINTTSAGLSPVRIEYRKSWKSWHDSTDNKDLYIKFPQSERQFKAPFNML
jgi:glycosyltransferase involved in cell wall biosynthesis